MKQYGTISCNKIDVKSLSDRYSMNVYGTSYKIKHENFGPQSMIVKYITCFLKPMLLENYMRKYKQKNEKSVSVTISKISIMKLHFNRYCIISPTPVNTCKLYITMNRKEFNIT